MYSENDFIQLSALQHFSFCERQCALIHIEQLWHENLFTAEGRLMHNRTDSERTEVRNNMRIESSVPLRSFVLGVSGKSDVVEFHKQTDGSWVPYPVEYKRGKKKANNCDRVQLCAQAMCLEEMLNVQVMEGALFYGKTRRREIVSFELSLRFETQTLADKVHKLIASGSTPSAVYEKKCQSCSLIEQCLPKLCNQQVSVQKYLKNEINFIDDSKDLSERE